MKGWTANISNIWRRRCRMGIGGWKLVVDAAHGAATYLAPGVVRTVGREGGPDRLLAGRAQHQFELRIACIWKWLRARVLETGADLGVAFDGDADRALFVSHSGKIVDGDAVMLLTARPLHKRGRLKEVIATVMSNLGPGAGAEATRDRAGADSGGR